MRSKKEKKPSNKKSLTQRVNEWDVEEAFVEKLLDAIIAVIVFCLLASWSLVNLYFFQHLVSLLILPILVYYSLGSRGLKLRLRERRSLLLITDILSLALIVLVAYYMDDEFYYLREGWPVYVALSVVCIAMLTAYLVRSRVMYRLVIFAGILSTILVTYGQGLDMMWVELLTVGSAAAYLLCVARHSFYFGYGRAMKDGKYCLVSEEEAKVYRAQEKVEIKRLKEEAARKRLYARQMKAEESKKAKKAKM